MKNPGIQRRRIRSQEGVDLPSRLHSRRDELEQAALTRIRAISDPSAAPDPAYLNGLRAALAAALDYGLAAIAAPGRDPEPVPIELLSQARLAARNGVSLDAVLRRYSAGHTLLADTLLEEAAAAGIAAADLRVALRALAARFDRVVTAVSEEYGREAEIRPQSCEERRTDLVERLLVGELLDTSELAYELDCWHLGLHVVGPGAADAIRDLASDLDRRLLLVCRDQASTWAWLGGRLPFDSDQVLGLTSYPWPVGVRVAVGEPAAGLPGWRFTHRQAAVTLPIALRGEARVAHYAEAPLLASALQDELLAASLRRLYLEPLKGDRDGGRAAKATLRAYFCAAGNVSSAAAALGVNRATVRSRLSAIEERFGRPLEAASAEIETALRLDKIEAS